MGQKVKERHDSSDKRIRITPKRAESNKDFRSTVGKKSSDRKRDDTIKIKYERKPDKKINLKEHKNAFNSRLDILERMYDEFNKRV